MHRLWQSVLAGALEAKPAPRLGRKRAVRPRLEALEDRLALSCTAAQRGIGGALYITGDDNLLGNQVKVIQDDEADTIKIDCDGAKSTFVSSQVATVFINLKAGADDLDWILTRLSDFNFAKTLKVNLGKGDDVAFFDLIDASATTPSLSLPRIKADLSIAIGVNNLSGDVDNKGSDHVLVNLGHVQSADVTVKAKLGLGKDVFEGRVLGDVTGDSFVGFEVVAEDGDDSLSFEQSSSAGRSIDSQASVMVNFQGGAGVDTATFSYEGEMHGNTGVYLYGGGDGDTLQAGLGISPGSSGKFDAKLSGDGGNDLLALMIEGQPAGLDILQALIDGGGGTDDKCKKTSNVSQVECEGVWL